MVEPNPRGSETLSFPGGQAPDARETRSWDANSATEDLSPSPRTTASPTSLERRDVET
jgi:hypothetical protein